MKKIIAVLLVTLLVFCCGCGKKAEKPDAATQEKALEKLEGEIERAKTFSGGRTFVKLKGDNSKNYCINQNGEILYDIPAKIFEKGSAYAAKTSGFYEGVVLVSDSVGARYDSVYDADGEGYGVEDFGVYSFHPDAMADGYIITFTAATTTQNAAVGVLDLKLDWVVQPSSQIAEELGFLSPVGAQNIAPFYKDGILYGYNASLEIASGDVVSQTYDSHGIKEKEKCSEYWTLISSGSAYAFEENDKLSFKVRLNNAARPEVGLCSFDVMNNAGFTEGKAPVLYGEIGEKRAFSLMDESGNLLFEPIECGMVKKVLTSGDSVLVVTEEKGKTFMKTFDLQGDALGEMQFEPNYYEYATNYYFEDEILVIVQKELESNGVEGNVIFYNKKLEKLF